MSFEAIKYEIEENILTVTLNRPERLNAFTGQMLSDFIDVFDKADADDNVRAIIVTGAGRGFCAGADLSAGGTTFDFDTHDDAASRSGRDGGGILTLRIFASLKPVIAAVNGAAVGMGATLQLPMDVRIASEDAKFGFVFGRRGITPEACSAWFLPRIVGISQALEWTVTGRVFSAQEALAGGLISKVVKAEELLPTARALAREIADNTAPVSVALTRQMFWRMLGAEHPMDAHIVDSKALMSRGASEDAMEGITAFLEKRPAKFPNRVSKDMPDFFPWWKERTFG